eukprot:Pgem_evm1s3250
MILNTQTNNIHIWRPWDSPKAQDFSFKVIFSQKIQQQPLATHKVISTLATEKQQKQKQKQQYEQITATKQFNDQQYYDNYCACCSDTEIEHHYHSCSFDADDDEHGNNCGSSDITLAYPCTPTPSTSYSSTCNTPYPSTSTTPTTYSSTSLVTTTTEFESSNYSKNVHSYTSESRNYSKIHRYSPYTSPEMKMSTSLCNSVSESQLQIFNSINDNHLSNSTKKLKHKAKRRNSNQERRRSSTQENLIKSDKFDENVTHIFKSKCYSFKLTSKEDGNNDNNNNTNNNTNKIPKAKAISMKKTNPEKTYRFISATPPGANNSHTVNQEIVKCSNCQTTQTSLWRRNVRREILCNACGLYENKYNRVRPLKLQKKH